MNELNQIKDYKKDNKIDIDKVMNDFTPYIYTVLINKNSMLSGEDIEEIISDTFLALWKNQEQLDENKKISAYLVGIVNNLYYKKFRKFTNNIDISDLENELIKVLGIEEDIIDKEKENIILNEINQMKNEDKIIFKMYYYHSKSIKDIANQLKIKEEKVKSRLHRIRKKIKKELEERGYSYYG